MAIIFSKCNLPKTACQSLNLNTFESFRYGGSMLPRSLTIIASHVTGQCFGSLVTTPVKSEYVGLLLEQSLEARIQDVDSIVGQCSCCGNALKPYMYN
jgi:ABC-type phosphate transport system auxiliary subunit